MTHRFIEENLVMVPLETHRLGSSVVEGKDLTPAKVKALADAADACWSAILAHDLQAFASAYKASFNAQIAMFSAMVNPVAYGKPCLETSVEPYIQKYSAMPGVLAWKMMGAGGGDYLALVVEDAKTFEREYEEAIELHIRRP